MGFEALRFLISCTNPICCIVIYCPPKLNSTFLSELSDCIAAAVFKYDQVIMVGEFNFHVNDATNVPAIDFISVTESFNLLQHVKGPPITVVIPLTKFFNLGHDTKLSKIE